MPFYRMGHSMVHLHLSPARRKKAPPPCGFFVSIKSQRVRCMAITTYLCDWPGCNVPFCEDHCLNLGPDLDVCPTHNARRGLFSRLLPAPQLKGGA
ncbi:MAG TPA: hypothetical protein VIL30_17225 [Ramlibacter sp.]|jgi:hypothetical protein